MKKNLFYHPLVRGICLVLCFASLLAFAFCGFRCIHLDYIGLMRETPEFTLSTNQRLQYSDSIHLYWPERNAWEYMAITDGGYWYTGDTLFDRLQNLLRREEWQSYLWDDGEMPQIVSESGFDYTMRYPAEDTGIFRDFLGEYSAEGSNLRFRLSIDDTVILTNDAAWDKQLRHASSITSDIIGDNGKTGHTVTVEYGLLLDLKYDDDYATYYNAWQRDAVRWESWLLATGITAAAAFVFLLCVLFQTGMRYSAPGVRLNVIDRLPLEPVLFVEGGLLLLCCAGIAGLEWYGMHTLLLLYSYVRGNALDWMIPLGIIALFVAAVWLLLTVLCSIARRVRGGKWWRNTLVYRVFRVIFRGVRWMYDIAHQLFSNLPLTAKWLAGCAVFGLWTLLVIFADGLVVVWFLTALAAGLFLCVYMLEFDVIRRGAKQMAAGDINYHTDTARLHGAPKQIGDSLNHIGDAISVAVEARMKSERFRTELITNVSHDLKTPLTSIINYTDLLTKEPCENETMKDYIDVLSRQAVRLKKLTEDLLEVSKASSGTLSVSLSKTDAAELLTQAVGEYEERFSARGLQPVLDIRQTPLWISADGRHLWRVFDNLLSNICKYSMHGTRVYLTAEGVGTSVVMTFRNIAENPIAVSADELTERFVRGDASRHTEGSGLGLAIADSLCKLQGGNLSLTVDGDLFKAVVTFDRIAASDQSGSDQSPS